MVSRCICVPNRLLYPLLLTSGDASPAQHRRRAHLGEARLLSCSECATLTEPKQVTLSCAVAASALPAPQKCEFKIILDGYCTPRLFFSFGDVVYAFMFSLVSARLG